MLVLSRKQGQQIIVSFGGEVATIEILKIDDNRVRVGIEAPQAIGVHRREVHEKITAKAAERVCCEAVTESRSVA